MSHNIHHSFHAVTRQSFLQNGVRGREPSVILPLTDPVLRALVGDIEVHDMEALEIALRAEAARDASRSLANGTILEEDRELMEQLLFDRRIKRILYGGC